MFIAAATDPGLSRLRHGMCEPFQLGALAGFGGSTKCSMGKKLVASQLEGLYTKVTKAAEK